jgi:chemotaxis protein MotB
MSMSSMEERRQEIIIVRRPMGDHDDGHHGGVWKIAFADFMTAMMCFFLVMWLINAANEETRASVASYFNPVKLIDRNSSRKGLEEIGDGPNAVGVSAEIPEVSRPKAGTDGAATSGPAENQASKDSIDAVRHSDENLFSDPYAVLAEIAAETGVKQNVSDKGDGGSQDSGPATGASGGEAFRDPFAPDFWSQQVVTPKETIDLVDESLLAREETDPSQLPPALREILEPTAVQDAQPSAVMEEKHAAEAPSAETEAIRMQSQEVVSAEEGSGLPAPAGPKAEEAAVSDAPDEVTLSTAASLKAQIAEALAEEERVSAAIEVTVRQDAVVISLTDQFDFGMFEIGSAVPRRELVLAMEKIGRILAEQPSKVRIGGHTDARPYRDERYDNWRLSTARAHAAYYMLVRGGLDEKRIKEVAGYADRQPRVDADPFAAANRRIEILVEPEA